MLAQAYMRWSITVMLRASPELQCTVSMLLQLQKLDFEFGSAGLLDVWLVELQRPQPGRQQQQQLGPKEGARRPRAESEASSEIRGPEMKPSGARPRGCLACGEPRHSFRDCVRYHDMSEQEQASLESEPNSICSGPEIRTPETVTPRIGRNLASLADKLD